MYIQVPNNPLRCQCIFSAYTTPLSSAGRYILQQLVKPLAILLLPHLMAQIDITADLVSLMGISKNHTRLRLVNYRAVEALLTKWKQVLWKQVFDEKFCDHLRLICRLMVMQKVSMYGLTLLRLLTMYGFFKRCKIFRQYSLFSVLLSSNKFSMNSYLRIKSTFIMIFPLFTGIF